MTLAANLMVSMASKFESKPLLPTLMETMAGRFGSRPLLYIYNVDAVVV